MEEEGGCEKVLNGEGGGGLGLVCLGVLGEDDQEPKGLQWKVGGREETRQAPWRVSFTFRVCWMCPCQPPL